MTMKYKVGDKVRIKSIDWYNNNKDEDGYIDLRLCSQSHHSLHPDMSVFCGKIVTITSIFEYKHAYEIKEDNGDFYWTDEMIEGLVEEETKPNIIEEAKTYWDSIKDAWICPEGYQFVDENGNVINATKIVLEKKKKEYPNNFYHCVRTLGLHSHPDDASKYKTELIHKLQKLLVCRDVYWKIAGEEMGLGKPWKPEGENTFGIFYDRLTDEIEEQNGYHGANSTFEFPTPEMRDAFYENFKELIEFVKKLL